MNNDYIFKVHTSGDIIDLEGRVIGHINLEYIKSIANRKQGEWKVKTISTFPQYQPDEYLCPFCNTIVNYKTNFCPNCGIKMGGTE